MTPELIDEPEIKKALALLIAKMDRPTARDVIAIVRAAYDAGFASCLVRPFRASDEARERLAQAAAIVARHLPEGQS
jgi:hypothetical protein